MIPYIDLIRAKEVIIEKLSELKSVYGIGIGINDTELYIKINVDRNISEKDLSIIPKSVDAIPIEISKVKGINIE